MVREHLNWVYASACRRVRDGALAEDVAQAVFLMLWRKLPELGSEVKLTGWLYRAVQYCSANAMRQTADPAKARAGGGHVRQFDPNR